jgi:ABC-type transporter Mla MlaB component
LLVGAPDPSLTASMRALRPVRDPGTIVVLLSGRIDRGDAVRLGEELTRLLGSIDVHEVTCDVAGLIATDAATVDALCRMRVAARRNSSRLLLRHAPQGLLDLLELTGLCDALPVPLDSGLEAERQPE